ncbi:MAG: LysM peptidoglycan-binding domain-containing protein [Desulfatiglans sp.]|nr:LysM peptidoglycan-binding domain-containing protein [Desulfatiglans sp.]
MDRQLPLRVEREGSSIKETDNRMKQTFVSDESLELPGEERSVDTFEVDRIASTHTEQELIDSALEYCQASNDFWEKGDLDNAIDCLDKAYSLTLKIDNSASPVILQEKEDLRITIAKRMLEVYSSRFTSVNGSHKAIPLVMNHHVQKAIDLFTKGREKEWFLKVYARSGKYRPAIVRKLKEAGLPEELSWLPFIESGYSTVAISSARALGMWQFIASTGYKYGLNRDNWIDERMNPEKATKAAIAYLTELHQIFGEWTTALAAYNCGEARVLRVINTQKINYMDNFWDLYAKLPSETAFYVPKFLAVLHIINNPSAYGIELPSLEKEIEYDKVNINKQISLKTLATELFVDYNHLKELNSELRQSVTPKTTYELKVPKGKGEILVAKLNDMPAYTPSTSSFTASASDYLIHNVKNGETLSTIAKKHKTSMDAIMAINNLKSKNVLRVGAKLKIPVGKYTYVATYSAPSGTPTRYTVRKGDSLWKIADRFGTTVKSIKALNGLEDPSLKVGQVLMITGGETSDTKQADKGNYTVKQGDSPYLIAKKHSMNLSEFLAINNLNPDSTIFPGQEVKIFTR